MKKYCLNCGYGNEYSINAPQICQNCKISFATSVAKVIHTPTQEHNNETPANNNDFEIEGSEFDSFMEEEPEQVSDDEIAKIFLKNLPESVNLRDLLPKDKKPLAQTQAKTKTRRSKRK